MKKNMLMIGLVCISLMSAGSVIAQSPLLFVGSDFQPYIWCEQDAAKGIEVASKGIDIAVLAELFRRIGQPYTLQCFPWKRALSMTQEGSAAGAFPGFKTPEREAFAVFLDDPLHVSQYSLFVKRGHEFAFETVDDLAGKTIGIERGHSVSPEFEAGVKAGKFKIEEASAPDHNLKKLLAGRVDAYINNYHVVLHTAKELGMLDQIVALPKPVTQGNPAYLMISNAAAISDKPQLIQRLNQTLHEMWQDGTVERLTAQYIQ